MRSVTCASCGLVGWADGEACKRCGRPLTLNQHAPGGAPPPPPPPRDYGAGYNYAPAQDYFGAPAKKRVGHAVASLVIGILGFFSFGIFLIGSLVGMTLGIVALKKEGSEPSVYGGRGLAIAGIVVNILALCMIVPLGIIAAIAIPNLLAARRAANEASAISILRTIHSAESTYAATTGNGSYATLPQLISVGLMDDKLSSGRVNGYFFTITASGNDFEVTAMPLTRTGSRSFYVSSPGVIRVAPASRLAGASDPPLEASYGSQYGSSYDSQYDSRPRRTVSQPDFQTAPSY